MRGQAHGESPLSRYERILLRAGKDDDDDFVYVIVRGTWGRLRKAYSGPIICLYLGKAGITIVPTIDNGTTGSSVSI